MKKDKLFSIFGGKYVHVLTRSIRGSHPVGEGIIVEGNVVLEGVLLDEDETHIYLGAKDTEIDQALKKEECVRVFIPNETDQMIEIEIDGDVH